MFRGVFYVTVFYFSYYRNIFYFMDTSISEDCIWSRYIPSNIGTTLVISYYIDTLRQLNQLVRDKPYIQKPPYLPNVQEIS